MFLIASLNIILDILEKMKFREPQGHNLKLTLDIMMLIVMSKKEKKNLGSFLKNFVEGEKRFENPSLDITGNLKLILDICTLGYTEF